MTCKKHPDAPHGFLRNASHSEGRYVCECESWTEPAEHAYDDERLVSNFDKAQLPADKQQVVIGRLRKKLAKVQAQRDHFRDQLKHYVEVVKAHPVLEHRHRKYTEFCKERAERLAKDKRLEEQALLIQMMQERREEVSKRITEYLASGGLFNPELMDHDLVRDLLISLRDMT